MLTFGALLSFLLLVWFGATGPAEAQQTAKVYRVGVLSYLAPDSMQRNMTTLREALSKQGYVEGRNLTLDIRTSGGKVEALPQLAGELVRDRVDVILAIAPLAIRAARQATLTIPIVMTYGDPAMFETLARPGGNVTGLAALAAELAGKQVELLKEAIPRATRVAVLRNPDQPVHVAKLHQAEVVARRIGVRLIVIDAKGPDDFDGAFLSIANERTEGLVVFADGVFRAHRRRLAELASRLRLPSVYGSEGHAEAGGLIAYVPDSEEAYNRAAVFVAKILRGAKPADLPVEQPSKFQLLVNLHTAKALGLTIPPALLLRADQVIE